MAVKFDGRVFIFIASQDDDTEIRPKTKSNSFVCAVIAGQRCRCRTNDRNEARKTCLCREKAYVRDSGEGRRIRSRMTTTTRRL